MNSVLSTLDSRATTESATAGRTEHVAGVHRVTGQYMYEMFFADKGETTKMDFVRYCVANIDVGSFKAALKDFVEIAAKRGDAFKKTAQNHQSVMRTAYGAWKFAAPHLNVLGADDSTGYQAMRVLGKQALEKAGRKWDGGIAPSKADKVSAQMDKAESLRLAEIRNENPQRDGESPHAWELRCRGLLAAEMAEDEGAGAERVLARLEVAELADKVRKLCGDNLVAVLESLINDPTLEINIG